MVLNKTGSVWFYGLMLGITAIILGLALSPAVREIVDNARNTTTFYGQPGLDCGNVSISNFNKAACTASDVSIFWFIGGILFIGIAIITAKIIF